VQQPSSTSAPANSDGSEYSSRNSKASNNQQQQQHVNQQDKDMLHLSRCGEKEAMERPLMVV
jgi:hypothetical protein